MSNINITKSLLRESMQGQVFGMTIDSFHRMHSMVKSQCGKRFYIQTVALPKYQSFRTARNPRVVTTVRQSFLPPRIEQPVPP